MTAKNFRDLAVWNMGKRLALEVYSITRAFPPDERYGLRAQMRRAAVSVPSNIAEGFNRLHSKEYRNFLFVSLGSCAELETQLEIAGELGYVDKQCVQELSQSINSESKMLRNLIKKVQESTS